MELQDMKIRAHDFPQRKFTILLPKERKYVWDGKKTILRHTYNGPPIASKHTPKRLYL